MTDPRVSAVVTMVPQEATSSRLLAKSLLANASVVKTHSGRPTHAKQL